MSGIPLDSPVFYRTSVRPARGTAYRPLTYLRGRFFKNNRTVLLLFYLFGRFRAI